MKKTDGILTIALEKMLSPELSEEQARKWIKDNSEPYRQLMIFYKCALMEVETKFRVLSETYSLIEGRNPIENIKSRIKTPESIFDKMRRNNYPFNVESVEKNLSDIAGIRIICSFQSDIYKLSDALLQQDDVILINKKDYISNPKPSGYRSLHLIIGVPIFISNEKKIMKVEVQFRTLAMDMWASIEHKIKYKKPVTLTEEQTNTLRGCSELSDMLDTRMEELYKSVMEEYYKESENDEEE